MFFPVCRLTGHAADVTRARIAPDLSSLASSSADKCVYIWDPSTGRAVRMLEGHREEVTDVCYHGSGNGVFTSSIDGLARMFDLRSNSGAPALIFETNEGDWLSCVASGNSLNSPILITGSTGGEISFFDVRAKALSVSSFAHYNAVCSLEVSNNDSLAVSSSLDGAIRMWSVSRADCLLTVNEKTSSPSPCAFAGFTSDGEGLIGLFLNSSLRLWSFKDRINSQVKFAGPKMTDSTKTFTNIDGKGGIAVPSEDGTVHFINSKKGKSIQSPFKAHSDDVLSVECRGDLLVSSGAGQDSSVVVWVRSEDESLVRADDYNLSFHLVSPQIEGLI